MCETWVRVPLWNGTIFLLTLTLNNHNNLAPLQASFQSSSWFTHNANPMQAIKMYCVSYVIVPTTLQETKMQSCISHHIFKRSPPTVSRWVPESKTQTVFFAAMIWFFSFLSSSGHLIQSTRTKVIECKICGAKSTTIMISCSVRETLDQFYFTG